MSISLVAGSLTIRSWHEADAEGLSEAIAASIDHLHPFLPWVAAEPLSLAERRAQIARWTAEADAGGDEVVGLFLDHRVVGGSGLHRRIGPGGLEIGYWVHVDFTRRGIASAASRALTAYAFAMPDIDRVEIHHDAGNIASEGVPRGLGFRLVGEQAQDAKAPAETGVHRIWRVTRAEWTTRAPT